MLKKLLVLETILQELLLGSAWREKIHMKGRRASEKVYVIQEWVDDVSMTEGCEGRKAEGDSDQGEIHEQDQLGKSLWRIENLSLSETE